MFKYRCVVNILCYCVAFHAYLAGCVYFRSCGRWEETCVRSWSVTCENSKKIFSVTRTRRTSDNWKRIDYEPSFNLQLAAHSTRLYVLSRYSFLGVTCETTVVCVLQYEDVIIIRSNPCRHLVTRLVHRVACGVLFHVLGRSVICITYFSSVWQDSQPHQVDSHRRLYFPSVEWFSDILADLR